MSSRISESVPQKGPEYSLSGHCGENFYRGLALLLGLIVKLSPGANFP